MHRAYQSMPRVGSQSAMSRLCLGLSRNAGYWLSSCVRTLCVATVRPPNNVKAVSCCDSRHLPPNSCSLCFQVGPVLRVTEGARPASPNARKLATHCWTAGMLTSSSCTFSRRTVQREVDRSILRSRFAVPKSIAPERDTPGARRRPVLLARTSAGHVGAHPSVAAVTLESALSDLAHIGEDLRARHEPPIG